MTVHLLADGIYFPATQIASSTLNVQDDYEEGTWTVTAQGNWGTNPASQNTQYVKIGEQVFLQAYHVGNVGSSGGVAIGTGTFPFTISGNGPWTVETVNINSNTANFYGKRATNGLTKWEATLPGGISGAGWYHGGSYSTIA